MIKMIPFLFLLYIMNGCSGQEADAIAIEKITLDAQGEEHGYYLMVRPKKKIETVLVLLPGFGQKAEDVFLDTKFHELANDKNILVVGFAGRTKLACDKDLRVKINSVLADVIEKTNVQPDNFVLGGFSAGGVIALRYTELCHQFPEEFPIKPRGVFMADSPVDLFHSWKLQQEVLTNNLSEISVNEAKWVTKYYRDYYGATPSEDPDRYIDLSPFSIDKELGENEQFLKDVAVRAYHDIDISWRLVNRNQTAKNDNYIATSELINRLMLMGNEQAEFIQTFKTGYRRNGDRHPHSWSIIDEKECMEWIGNLMNQHPPTAIMEENTNEKRKPMINRLQFSIDINADKTKIWKALWDDTSYRDWASVFSEGSYATSDNWEVGTKAFFLDLDQNGIYSLIEIHIPNQKIRFKHIGMVAKGKEQPIDEETKKWSGATETYTLTEGDDSITLTIDIDVLDEHLEFMSEKLPLALQRIKDNCN